MLQRYDDFACIARTVGERTTKTCVALLRNFFGEANLVQVVSKQPFNAALAESMAAAIKLGKPWTLMIDADVLCSRTGLAKMLEMARELPSDTYMFHGSVVDKFFGRYRRAGNRVYQTCALAKAITRIPACGASLRPEFHTCEAMREAGWRNFQTYQIIGLHDYEQSYGDILRKIALFALKHDGWNGYFERYWQSHPDDGDFQAALDALKSANRDLGKISLDLSMLDRIPEAVRAKWAAKEKPEMPNGRITAETVNKLIASELEAMGIVPTANIQPREIPPCAG